MTRIYPSLAAAPMHRLGDVLAALESANVDAVHFDLEDGSFVPVMTLGTKIIQDLRSLTTLPFDVHLMMANPEWILPTLLQAGSNRISIHYEACLYPRRVLRLITEGGAKAGLAFNPATPLPELPYLRPYLSFVVLLTSEPEVPDSPFLPQVLAKLSAGKAQPGLEGIEWVVDGGLNLTNLHWLRGLPVDSVVIGRAVFCDGLSQVKNNISGLRYHLQADE